MNITLLRDYYDDCVEGRILDDQGKQICFSLELPERANKQGESCIDEGTYKFQKLFSSTLGWVYRLQDVPNRSLIDVHSGNTILDIRGCIIVGTKQGTLSVKGGVYTAVLNSRDALATLFSVAGTSGMITIKAADAS